MMKADDWRVVFSSAGLIMILAVITPLLLRVAPHQQEEGFVSLAVLGENMKLQNYFPGKDANVALDQTIKWNLVISNYMGSSQYILIKVKIVDSNQSTPNNILGLPSPNTPIYEFRQILPNNRNVTVPFSWNVQEATSFSDHTAITKITFNQTPTNLNIEVSHKDDLRMVFELWIYDVITDTFIFDWNIDTPKPKICWNQIWFNLSI